MDPAYFPIYLGELRIYFNETRVGDRWNSGKMNNYGFCKFYFVSVDFE